MSCKMEEIKEYENECKGKINHEEFMKELREK